jgi:hypothetical protein
MPQATPISPLRQRLIDDMTTRRLARTTQVAYINKWVQVYFVSPVIE